MSDRDRAMQVRVVGFLDDDSRKAGSRLHGARIYGPIDRLPEAVRATHAAQLVVAMPSAPGSVTRRAVEAGRALGLTVKIVPPLHEILGGHADITRLRPVSVDDLLRRDPVRVDLEELAGYLNGASVVVTGGGGSIGSELARQIFALGPRRLAILDNSEAALWAIERELSERRGAAGPVVDAILCDVRLPNAVDRAIEAAAPDVVFHAAALKHVPICEAHPAQAVLTNVIGTRNVLDACERHAVPRFVLISTDKAVHPVSVMGATKRLAEILTLTMGRRTNRAHMAVRFGNVLGSSGSVVPLFRRQLEQGLPLTITHREATRYFMTIPEAVSLILQAGASDTSGDVYVLDMGQPVRIVDLAEDMIRLSGLDPAAVEIVFTGLRPGERLTERLLYEHEAMQPTEHERVLRAEAALAFGLTEPSDRLVARLERVATASDDRAVRAQLVASGVLQPAEHEAMARRGLPAPAATAASA
jgi:FlaA1/EpsC-like NDP-sugar epimerase